MQITFGNCPALTGCGGAPIGTWHYTAACMNNPFAQASTICPTSTINNLAGTLRGSLVFTPTVVTRNVTSSVTGTLSVPATCLMGIFTCSQIQTQLAAFYPGAQCQAAAGGCSCTLTQTNNLMDSSAYTLSSSSLLVGAGTYDYCIQPNTTMRYRRTGQATFEDGLMTLTKQ